MNLIRKKKLLGCDNLIKVVSILFEGYQNNIICIVPPLDETKTTFERENTPVID